MDNAPGPFGFQEALAEFYEPVGPVFDLDEDVFWPISGMTTRPHMLYEPRAAPAPLPAAHGMRPEASLRADSSHDSPLPANQEARKAQLLTIRSRRRRRSSAQTPQQR